jgi:hypothetical protein
MSQPEQKSRTEAGSGRDLSKFARKRNDELKGIKSLFVFQEKPKSDSESPAPKGLSVSISGDKKPKQTLDLGKPITLTVVKIISVGGYMFLRSEAGPDVFLHEVVLLKDTNYFLAGLKIGHILVCMVEAGPNGLRVTRVISVKTLETK